MILLSVLITLLLLRNSRIFLHQSSNFVQLLSNHPGFGTIFLGNPVCPFSWFVVTGATNISVSVHSLLIEASLLICKDSSHSDNASISFILLELVLTSCSYCYTCFVFSTDNTVSFHS